MCLSSSGAGEDQAHGAELVDRGDQRAGGADAGDLFDDDADRDGVSAGTAILLGHVDGRETALVERLERLDGEAFVLVDIRRMGLYLVLTDLPDDIADHPLLVSEGEEGIGHGASNRFRHDNGSTSSNLRPAGVSARAGGREFALTGSERGGQRSGAGRDGEAKQGRQCGAEKPCGADKPSGRLSGPGGTSGWTDPSASPVLALDHRQPRRRSGPYAVLHISTQ